MLNVSRTAVTVCPWWLARQSALVLIGLVFDWEERHKWRSSHRVYWSGTRRVNVQFTKGKAYWVSGGDNTGPDSWLAFAHRGEAFPPTKSSQGLLTPGLCGGFWTGFPGPNKVIQSMCALDLAVWCGNPKKSCVLLHHGFIPISALLNCTIPWY